jgi:hypothetical protein
MFMKENRAMRRWGRGVALAVLAGVMAGCVTQPGGGEPPSQRLLTRIQAFRQLAGTQPEQAFVAFTARGNGQKLFGPLGRVLCPKSDPSRGWAYFFSTAVSSMSFLDGDKALALFYHPYSDVALLVEWRRDASGGSIADAELLIGDALRRRGVPPYDIEPEWLRSQAPPSLAAALATAQTVREFQRIYGSEAGAPKGGWRAAVPAGRLLLFNHAGVGQMYEANLGRLLRFLQDPDSRLLRERAGAVLEQLRLNQPRQALALAPDTPAESRAVLERAAAAWGEARAITCVTKRDQQNRESTFVLYSLPGRPDQVMSLCIRKDSRWSTAQVRRIDLVDQNETFRNQDAIRRFLKAP